MIRLLPDKLRGWLQSRHLPWQLALLAMVLCAPSLRLGRHFDDNFHRLALTQPEGSALHRSPAELFKFIEGDEAVNRQSVVMGMLPWWSHEGLRLAFFRPVTGLTHWFDYKIWPDFPSLMHVHSLVWLGAAIAVAAWLYRRMLGPTWIAGLAALLYAVDDAHAAAATWLANRNVLIGVFFGLLTLIAHDRWRRDGWLPGAVLAPMAFLLGLLSKESAVAIGAYLFAYALFLDRGRWVGRLASLMPCALIGVSWWMAYRQLGYGTVGSEWYVDPGAEPMRFLQAVAARAPALLAWQWVVPSDLEWALSPETAHGMWLATMGLLVILAVVLAPLLRRDARARFWALGMILSLLPACTAYPQGRLLSFVGIGGIALLAQLIAVVVGTTDRAPVPAWRRLPAYALGGFLVFVHLCMAPRALVRTAETFDRSGRAVTQAAASLPSDATPLQTVLVVSTPSYGSFVYCALTRLLEGPPYLSRTLVLGSGSQPIEIHRPDERTLSLRPRAGFLAPPGNPHPGRAFDKFLFDWRCLFKSIDGLYRDGTPVMVGQRIQMMGVSVEITETTADGRPAEIAFRSLVNLNNPLLRWLRWKDDGYVPFEVPAVGETVTVPSATLPLYGDH